MVITKDKPAIDTQKIKIEWTRLVKEVVESQRKTAKEAKKKKIYKAVRNNKLAIVNHYLSILILNISGLNYPIKGQKSWMDKKNRFDNMLPIRDSVQL